MSTNEYSGLFIPNQSVFHLSFYCYLPIFKYTTREKSGFSFSSSNFIFKSICTETYFQLIKSCIETLK